MEYSVSITLCRGHQWSCAVDTVSGNDNILSSWAINNYIYDSHSFIGFGSSVEDINEETAEELRDYLSCSTSSLPPIPTIPKSHSLAVMMPLPNEEIEADDSTYEGILMTNIKLWKHSQQKLKQVT